MGGTVTVVIRESDGTEHRMQRWTNSLPWGICNAKMLEEDRTHIDAYLSQWLSMKDDWDKNHFTENFQFNMTSVYFPSVGFAPQEYGFVLVDFKTKHILTMQGYTSLSRVLGTAIHLEATGGIIGADPDDETEAGRLSNLIRAGRVKSYRLYGKKSEEDLPLPDWLLKDPSEPNVIKFVESHSKNFSFMDFEVDLSPFTIIDYERGNLDVRDAYLKIKELGFLLSKEEDDIWQEWIEEAKRYDEEECA